MKTDVFRRLSNGTQLPIRSPKAKEPAYVICRQVAEYALLIHETDLKYPIILSVNGRVMEGLIRVAKALIEVRETVDAVQFEQDAEPDYI